jgi:hypothetical protein
VSFEFLMCEGRVEVHENEMLTMTGIVPGTIVESHRDADKEEDKLLSKWVVKYIAYYLHTDVLLLPFCRRVLFHRS